MTNPTKTLQQLRRDICVELGMPFFQRYMDGCLSIDATSTTSKIVDAQLSQKQAFWNGSWHYHVSTQETSKIRSFSATENAYHLEVPLAASPSSGDYYEIHSGWSAPEIHWAINRAIESAQRIFFSPVTDETLILQEDILEYDLSGLGTVPWIISKIFIEQKTARYGAVQSATNTTMEVENSSVTSGVTSSWYVSIYAGTGAGQLRAVSSASGTTVTVSTWNTNPDDTSKYCLWDSSEQLYPWRKLEGVLVDTKEWPGYLYFQNRLPSYYGMRLRLEYIAYPSTLSAETDTTTVPSEYIINKAASMLFGKRLRDNKVDRDAFYGEAERYRALADAYEKMNAPHKPDVFLKATIQTEYYREDDPLGWYTYG